MIRNKGMIKLLISIIVIELAVLSYFKFTNNVGTLAIVKGDSMLPNLKDSEICFVRVIKNDNITRDSIVVIQAEAKDNAPEDKIVKRVVGLPNETIDISLDNKIYINGDMENPYIPEYSVNGETYNRIVNDEKELIHVELGPDEYYCLGDNREYSSDSRFYGPFKREQILYSGYVKLQ